jgi:hypothetical protein
LHVVLTCLIHTYFVLRRYPDFGPRLPIRLHCHFCGCCRRWHTAGILPKQMCGQHRGKEAEVPRNSFRVATECRILPRMSAFPRYGRILLLRRRKQHALELCVFVQIGTGPRNVIHPKSCGALAAVFLFGRMDNTYLLRLPFAGTKASIQRILTTGVLVLW